MANALLNLIRLARAGRVLAWHGVHVAPKGIRLPVPVRLFRGCTAFFYGGGGAAHNQPARLTKALTKLGPSYIKLGQFLATRPDVIGRPLASDLSQLQDRLPPFSMAEAKRAVEQELGRSIEELFASFSEPVAAASIAQVHRAMVMEADGVLRPVAVKILRPRIEARFRRDLESFYFAARQMERWHSPSRRLRPIAALDMLASSVAIEMDLRMEAAAMSEMAENAAKAQDRGFRIPKIDWARTARRVLTTEWVEGISITDHAALDKAGIDRETLGNHLIRTFLRHAIRDGFFHADMHPGNLFVDGSGGIIAVDFGIMGRLGPKERRFLAEILYGFITRNYRRVADVHFDAGYVPSHQSTAEFAQALRAIGEPLMDRAAEDISMARLLTQLFEVTELFGMETRPELLMLQKTMVVVEGVARSLDPRLNIWTAAEPVVKEWLENQIGPRARLREAAEGATNLIGLIAAAPQLAEQAAKAGQAFAALGETGIRLDQPTIERMAEAQSRRHWLNRAALLIGALSLAAIAIKLWLS